MVKLEKKVCVIFLDEMMTEEADGKVMINPKGAVRQFYKSQAEQLVRDGHAKFTSKSRLAAFHKAVTKEVKNMVWQQANDRSGKTKAAVADNFANFMKSKKRPNA